MEYDIEEILYTFEDDYNPSSMVPGPRNMYSQGQLVRNTVDGSRPGYSGDKVYSDNYRTIYDKKTKLYSKKVGRDKKLLTQNPDETKKQFFNRVSNYSDEKATERTSKFTKEIMNARSKIDSWTSNWLNNNLENYGVKDFDKMTKDMKKDWKIQSKKLKLPTDKIQITTKTGFPNLSTSKGKESAVSKNPFSYNDVTFYTPENPSGMDKYKAQWKKIFYKNKIQTTPGLKENVKKYFDFINLDKRGAVGGQTIESFKNILDKDILFLLSEKDSGLQKGSKFEVFNSFDDLAKSYNEFTAKINRSETWKENANLIEKELGLKKNSIKNSMVKEQKAAAKFFGLNDLKGTGLEYSIEHGQGLSAAARSGNKDLMRTALNDLIGTTKMQNTAAGFGGFEATRGALIRDIEAGVNIKDNVSSLNKLTKDAYKDLGVKSNIYSIKDGKLTSKPITTATTQADRFTQYAETIYKDPKGKTAIDKKFGNLDILKKDLLKLAGTKNKKCKNLLSYGGRVGLAEGLSPEFCINEGKKVAQEVLFEGGGTPAQKSVARRLISAGGKMALSMVNPRELIRLSNLVGPGALGLMGLYEAGSITDDVLRLNKPLDEALAGNWLTKSFLPYSEEFAKQKNLLQSGQLTGDQKEYALEMMKMENFIKEGQRIEGLESNKLVEGTLDDNFTFTSKEDMNKAYKDLIGKFSRIKPYAYEQGITGRGLENEAAMNEYIDAQTARTGASKIFGGPQPMVNKAPRPKNMTRGPMTEKGKMNLDYYIPGYTPYDKAYTPTDEEILQLYRNQGIVPATFGGKLQPGEGTRVRMGLASQGDNRSIYGSKFSEGGITGLRSKYEYKK